MPCIHQGTGKSNQLETFPTTPTLIKKYFPQYYNSYMKERNNLLKEDTTIYDPNLRDYQNSDVGRIIKMSSMGIFNEQRLGKTPTILVGLREKHYKGRTLIVAPKSTLFSWKKEVEKWFTKSVEIINGNVNKRKEIYASNTKVILGTYETIAKDCGSGLIKSAECMVLDEAHRLRNYIGQRAKSSPTFTKQLLRFSKKVAFKYALTGTPVANYGIQIYPILHFLYPNIFTSYSRFLDYFYDYETVYTRDNTIKVPTELKKDKTTEMIEFLSTISIQRKRKNHMKWLNSVDHRHVSLDLPPKTRKHYTELYDTYECQELGIDCPNKLVLLTRLRQMTAKNKAQYVLDYIKDYPNEQIIIVSTFTSLLKEIHAEIKKVKAKLIIGDTSTINRGKIQEDFNKKKINIILGNANVIAEGMKLEQCETMIIIDPSLTYANNVQLYDRLVATSKEIVKNLPPQKIIHLSTLNTVDEYIDEQLNQKKSSAEIINNFKQI